MLHAGATVDFALNRHLAVMTHSRAALDARADGIIVSVKLASHFEPLGTDIGQSPINEKDAEPRLLTQPPPRGTEEQHMADAPCGRGQVAASSVHEPRGSCWRFCVKQIPDARASFKLFSCAEIRLAFFLLARFCNGQGGRSKTSRLPPPLIA